MRSLPRTSRVGQLLTAMALIVVMTMIAVGVVRIVSRERESTVANRSPRSDGSPSASGRAVESTDVGVGRDVLLDLRTGET